MSEKSIIFSFPSSSSSSSENLTIDGNEYKINNDKTTYDVYYYSVRSDITFIPEDSEFKKYPNLNEINFSNSITSIGNIAFSKNSFLNRINFSNPNTYIADNAFQNINHVVTTTIDSYAYKYFSEILDIELNAFNFLLPDKDYVVRCTDITSENSNTEEYASYFNIKANQIPPNAGETIFIFVLNFDNGNIFEFTCQAIHNIDNTFTVTFYYINFSISGGMPIYVDDYPQIYSDFNQVMLETFYYLNLYVTKPYSNSIVDGKCY